MARVAMTILLVVICMVLIEEAKSAQRIKKKTCRPGWISRDRHTYLLCYYISRDVKSQSEATAACKQMNALLFYPTSTYETRSLKWYMDPKQISTPFYWTSGHKVNYQWTWGVDPFTHPFHPPNWDKGQPDGPNKGECIAVKTKSEMMDDQPCENKYNYMCKLRL